MTDKPKLIEIEGRAGGATEGPWEERVDDLTDDVIVVHDQERVSHIAHVAISPTEPRAMEDATFIAASRTDVPALTAAVRAVLLELDKADRRAFESRTRDTAGRPYSVNTVVVRAALAAHLDLT